ncbi:unnamed protein product, partial [Prorocentrum cordatum]
VREGLPAREGAPAPGPAEAMSSGEVDLAALAKERALRQRTQAAQGGAAPSVPVPVRQTKAAAKVPSGGITGAQKAILILAAVLVGPAVLKQVYDKVTTETVDASAFNIVTHYDTPAIEMMDGAAVAPADRSRAGSSAARRSCSSGSPACASRAGPTRRPLRCSTASAPCAWPKGPQACSSCSASRSWPSLAGPHLSLWGRCTQTCESSRRGAVWAEHGGGHLEVH